MITEIQTQCKRSHLIYIGQIIGNEYLRPLVLLHLLEGWRNKNTSVLQVASESLTMDQNCPLYLASPRDDTCNKPEITPATSPPTTDSQPPLLSSSLTPSVSPRPTVALDLDNNNDYDDDDGDINIPILVACFIGGVFIGCFIVLCILVSVFCCHVRSKKKEDVE